MVSLFVALIVHSATTIRAIIFDTVIIRIISEIMLIMIMIISINIILSTVCRA